MSTMHRPGSRVPVSGIYNVVTAYGSYASRQVTCVEGEPFPPTVYAGEAGFVLARATHHR
jgi:hypothetical protein